MTTTRDRTRPPTREGQSAAPRAGLSRELSLLNQYLAHVEKARQYEAQALAQLRQALESAATNEPSGLRPRSHTRVPGALQASPHASAPSRRRAARSPKVAPRYLAIAALALAVVSLGWVLLSGGDEQAATSGKSDPHAGHQMGGRGSEEVRLAPGFTVPVDLGEFFVKPKYNKVRAGQVTFEVSNSGSAEHEFMVASVDELPQDQVEQLSGNEVHAKVMAAQHGIEAGASSENVTAELTPGEYLLFCNLPGHYAQGQYTVLRVA